MIARNKKSMMKLVRLPISRLLMFKREILLPFESFKN